jgi:hypothetical protein
MTAATGKTALQNRTLRWSSPALFNDPFDVQFDLHVEYDREKVIEKTMEEIWAAYSGEKKLEVSNTFSLLLAVLRDTAPGISEKEFRAEMHGAIEHGINRSEAYLPKLHADLRSEIASVKLLCLSELFDNILMWSHYSKDHTGIVLRLTCIESLDSAWGAAKPVRYERKMPRLLNESEAINLMSGQGSIDERAMLDNVVYAKAIDWDYEKEWRIFGGRDSSVKFEDIPFHKEELTAIYLGCRIDSNDKTQIVEIAKQSYAHVELFKGKKAERSFSLEFEKLTEAI